MMGLISATYNGKKETGKSKYRQHPVIKMNEKWIIDKSNKSKRYKAVQKKKKKNRKT